MPVGYAEARNIVFLKSAVSGDHYSQKRKEHMSRIIKAIERHMGPNTAAQPLHSCERKLVAEWQSGAEILGHVQRKLRLTFGPAQAPAGPTLSH